MRWMAKSQELNLVRCGARLLDIIREGEGEGEGEGQVGNQQGKGSRGEEGPGQLM